MCVWKKMKCVRVSERVKFVGEREKRESVSGVERTK